MFNGYRALSTLSWHIFLCQFVISLYTDYKKTEIICYKRPSYIKYLKTVQNVKASENVLCS